MAFALDIGLSYARNAGADLSGKLYYIAKVDTDGDIVLCGDGQAPLGVITEAAVENSPVTVQFGGIVKVIAAEQIAAGAIVSSDTDGKAVASAAGDAILGIALEGASEAGIIMSVALLPGRRHA